MANTMLPILKPQFLDADGAPLAGGYVAFYSPGTTDYKDVFGSYGSAVALTNPVPLDSAGMASIWLDGTIYDVAVYDGVNADPTIGDYGTLLYSIDNVFSYGTLTLSATFPWVDATNDTNLNGTIAAIGATNTEVWITSQQTLTASLTIPSNVHLRFLRDGIIVSDGYTLTIEGTIEAGLYQIFTGFSAGDVTFSSATTVYPEWWGAVGDGSTSDSTAIQNAINASRHVVFSHKTYILDYYINIDTVDDVLIEGDFTTLKTKSGLDDTSAYNTSFFKFTSCSNVTVRGITFDGNLSAYYTFPDDYAHYDAHRGIWIVDCTNVLIEHCIFTQLPGVGVKVIALGAAGGSSVPELQHDAALPGVDGLRILDCQFDHLYEACQINPSASRDIWFERNEVSFTEAHGFTTYPFSYNVYVKDNVFEDISCSENNAAIRFYETSFGVISGNKIVRTSYGILLYYYEVSGVNRHITIRDNRIVNTHYYGTTSGAIGVTGVDIDIDHNTIDESAADAKYVGIEIEGHNIQFRNNTINYTPSSAGIPMRIGYDGLHGAGAYSSDNINISDNKVTINGGTSAYAWWIPSTVNVTNVNYFNNSVSGYSNAEIYDPNCVVRYKHPTYVSTAMASATANITAAETVTITLSIPTNSVLRIVQFRVDAALATGEKWSAAFSGGSTTALVANCDVEKSSKYNKAIVPEVTTTTTNIAITKYGGGAFTAQGTIRAVVYYDTFDVLSSAE